MTTTATQLDWSAIRARLAATVGSHEGETNQSPEAAAAVLSARALELGQVPLEPPRASQVLELITFSLGGEWFAIETRYVRTVVRQAEITPVPGTPTFLAGVTNWRGEVLAIMNLGQVWGAARPAGNSIPWVLVLGTERAEFGLVADDVNEVRMLPLAELLAPAGSSGAYREWVRGVTAEAMLVLDGAALLSDAKLVVDETE